MMNRTSAPPKGPRNSSSNTKGSGRVGGGGGITKRRGLTRVDKDGDLDMDTAAGANGRKSGKGGKSVTGGPIPTGPRGHGRGGARNTGRGGRLDITRNPQAILRGMGSQSQQANVLVTLWVKGLKGSKAYSSSDQGFSSLVSFLERKASTLNSKSPKSVKIKKSHKKGDIVVISVTQEDATTIKKLDGFTFAGSAIAIHDTEPSSQPEESEEARSTREKIQEVLARRYNVDLKLLDLSALGQDVQLKQMGMFDDSSIVSKLFPVLMVICDKLFTSRQAKKDAIVSITLADNQLADVSNITSLAATFPDLKNLDLSRNQFSGLESLKLWRWKFRHLENLILSGNPIENLAPDYTTEIVRWYPELQQLNGFQVRSAAQVVADLEAIQSPFPIASATFQDVGQVGENFVRQFFGAYDNDRNTLLTNFYDAQSKFSLSINMSAVRDRNHSMPIPPWAAYNKINRNLVKCTHLSTRLSRQHIGIQAIQPVWSDLPKTRHPEIATQPEKYLVECQTLPGLPDPSGQSAAGVDGLLITIHGEFEEEITNFEGKALRSYSRTFILGPGGPNGPPIRVISDLLALRAWAPLAKTLVQATQVVQVVPEVPTPGVPLTAEQQQAVLAEKLAVETGMNLQYSALCLTETGWDLEKAYVAFQANKANLPAEAYQKP